MHPADKPAEMRPAAPGLSSEEVARVLRRAADLDAQAAETARMARADQVRTSELDRFDPATVEKAAREAGLSPEAVQQALAELGAGSLATGEGGARLEARLARNQAVEARLVALWPHLVHMRIDPYLRRQTFVLSHRHAQWAVYRRRRDLIAGMRRFFNPTGALQLAGVETVTVSVLPANPASLAGPAAPAEPRDLQAPATGTPPSGTGANVPLHMVRLEAELIPRLGGPQLRTAGTGIAAGGSVGIVGVILLPGLLIPGVAAVASGAGVGFWMGRRLLRRRRDQVSKALAALLNRLD